jgi:hypothetical protein
MTPTARSLAEGRRREWRVDVVERWIGGGRIKVRKDLFGCIDLVALDGRPGVLGIQATSRSNVSARVRKIREECWPAAEAWLRAGNRLEVWGWGKLKAGWALRVVAVELDGAESPETAQAGLDVDLGPDEPPAEG